jgi:uncharacterized YigZ family protein
MGELMQFLSVKDHVQAEIEEKKSRFIADIMPVGSESGAVGYIQLIKKKYYDAKHHCYAYIVNDGESDIKRSSDDGEPSHTAGAPILDALEARNIKNAVCVVTRYFGGTLLGTGGLIRAYKGAVTEALLHALLVNNVSGIYSDIFLDYQNKSRFEYEFNKLKKDNCGILALNGPEYTDKLKYTVFAACDMQEKVEHLLSEMTNGACIPVNIHQGLFQTEV